MIYFINWVMRLQLKYGTNNNIWKPTVIDAASDMRNNDISSESASSLFHVAHGFVSRSITCTNWSHIFFLVASCWTNTTECFSKLHTFSSKFAFLVASRTFDYLMNIFLFDVKFLVYKLYFCDSFYYLLLLNDFN